jgi:hypothetical protein
LAVKDIRIIPAAQDGNRLKHVIVDPSLLSKYPILAYRIANIQCDKAVRGISDIDTHSCGLVLDDMAVCGRFHYPCIIYMREGGNPIGEVGIDMREQRLSWFKNHNSHNDNICSKNCLDVCVDYNNTFDTYHPCV